VSQLGVIGMEKVFQISRQFVFKGKQNVTIYQVKFEIDLLWLAPKTMRNKTSLIQISRLCVRNVSLNTISFKLKKRAIF
jgi:hypothetical protein